MNTNRTARLCRSIAALCLAIGSSAWGMASPALAQADTGSIAGSVVDPGANPVSGATVCAYYFSTFALADCVQTEADGSYAIPDLIPGDHRVEVSAAGWAFERYDNQHYGLPSSATPVTVTAGTVTSGIDFTLEPGGSVGGTVYESDGATPIGDVSVMVVFPDGSSRGVCSDAGGAFSIERIVYGVPLQVHAYSEGNFCGGPEGYAEEYWEESATAGGATALTLSAGTPAFTGLVFTLDELPPVTPTITGTVTDYDGNFIPGATVCAFDFDTFVLADCTQTGIYGYYALTDLTVGSYRVEVSAAGWAFERYDNQHYGLPSSATPVTVTAGTVTSGIDFTLEPGGSVSGTVYESDGATPIGDVSVMVVFPDGSSRGVCSDAGGAFSIERIVYGVPLQVHAYSEGNFCGGPEGYAEEYWQESPAQGGATVLTLSAGTPAYEGLVFTLDALTPLGDDVTISPAAGITIIFDSVTRAGQTAAHAVPVGPPEVPADFQVLGTYYEITTTAEFTTAQVCFTYSDADLTPAEEATLRLNHFEDGHWADVTDLGYPFTAENRLCGTVSQFSPFAILLWLNRAPMAEAGPDQSASEGDRITLDATGSTDPHNDITAYEWDLDGDGFYDALGPTIEVTYPDDVSLLIGLQVTDAYGLSDTDTVQVIVANVAPLILTLSAPQAAVAVGAPIQVGATFDDPGVLDTFTATWSWGDGSTSEGVVSGHEVAGTHTYAAAGTYTLGLTLTDDDGGSASDAYRSIDVYRQSQASVTGGGWIRGTNPWRPVVFAFNARYLGGASVPSGKTVVVMPGTIFHSTSYEWLVVSGSQAQMQGTGRINGRGHYGFMLSMVDGLGRHGQDTIRIRIWNAGTGAIVYDSQPGEPIDAVPTALVRFGSIQIHAR